MAAEQFLDRQELRSGLLTRRSHSCRFVHLTFQEYLAAWNLANLSMEGIKSTIFPHLRDAQWFETLQLLGGELAKVSDEKLDQYVGYLLDNIGESLSAQAPVIALCANIVQDVKDVADISSATREQYLSSLRGTLHVFRIDSGVPAKTQLEVLTALIPLGASVKDHLVQATKSSHRAVRTQAVNTLVPHLPDNDLFDMLHVMRDRSQEPVFAYLSAIFERDNARAIRVLSGADMSGPKVAKALVMLMWHLHYIRRDTTGLLDVFKRTLASSSKDALWDVAWYLYDRPAWWEEIRDEVLSWTQDASDVVRGRLSTLWGYILRLRRENLAPLYQIAIEDGSPTVRAEAIWSIFHNDKSNSSKEFLYRRALAGC